ncbi:zinc finger protein-like [Tropilaelaps mercedesae]|uniref:Zinc finger protein-like n=1 Tax=Tropilaelaps mercedesae TaxID=418985 RepID=A0A1V9Y0R8_9ACAR|nr:zinc finger protein-like [Tropilaelaps mercedesae]
MQSCRYPVNKYVLTEQAATPQPVLLCPLIITQLPSYIRLNSHSVSLFIFIYLSPYLTLCHPHHPSVFELPANASAGTGATLVVEVPPHRHDATQRHHTHSRNTHRQPLAASLSGHRGTPTSHGPRHTCSFCSYSTIYKDTLIKHERTHTGDRPFRCLICGYAASQRNNVRIHAARKHGTLDCVYDERKVMRGGF